ncbi:hypothetical protein HETIRDRAFT_170452 [Heterobasidion irregulare TC 32-1]|uniref:WD40 repeat-like protein n=1 Tax=Heterobasidion irregulare (strain TC 32-1) TaxID=747525 RepID=W4KE05_HETIT|nr:uncharacterized protein HETIRDRAFT_170452 [Heterobasidion irregulare TC 32-1]ETW83984.1 hypothetical protein HETIRDRAFT_170452 [Heterobasidion irregulare TC 32-1]
MTVPVLSDIIVLRCVNALSWAKDGQLLLSGGDDTTVRLWRIDQGETAQQYPFVCQGTVQTGHTGNIFNAQMLPSSNRIATVAGDKQVRVFDVTDTISQPANPLEADRGTQASHLRVLRCHAGRTKRIVTEHSSDLFLTVGEDGTVRQHDLRVHHVCRSGRCPPPLVKVPHELSTLALSPLTPYEFVVAGDSPYGYLFDRRQTGRFIQEEWGILPTGDDVTTCVRRFGRKSMGPGERKGHEHVTGARMSTRNGHEVLLSYSADAVYLYSTRDDVVDSSGSSTPPAVVAPNTKHKVQVANQPSEDLMEGIESEWSASDADVVDSDPEIQGNSSSGDQTDIFEDIEESINDGIPVLHGTLPVIYPRMCFAGACNVQTVKDVNFFGPSDEFVVSGSDDGNFFVWRKTTGALHGVYEGDGSVVNVIESHPHLPLVAVSGIDTTVKLFAPVQHSSKFSRMSDAESIVSRNLEAASREENEYSALFNHYRLMLGELGRHYGEEGQPGCTFQ